MHDNKHPPDCPVDVHKERIHIMSSINLDAVRSLAVAGVVSLYSALMLAAAMGASGVGGVIA
jgi:hypothetical protein